jgi:hypothetical protein
MYMIQMYAYNYLKYNTCYLYILFYKITYVNIHNIYCKSLEIKYINI